MTIEIQPSEIDRLAPMPASVARLTRLVFDPAAEIEEIGRTIALDQALTANVLRWANSSWSASAIPILNVKDAVIRLGMSQILKLAVGNTVATPLKKPFPGYELAENELWRHGVAAGLAAENLPAYATVPIHRAAFTAALIHDIGKLLIERHLNAETVAELRRLTEEGRTYIEAENEVLGTDHALVGGAIARHWKFPSELVLAIEHHHDPHPQPDPLLDAVQVANSVAKLIGIGLGSEQMNLQPDVEGPVRLGLTQTSLESLCACVMDKLEETEAMWDMKPKFY